KRSFKAAVLNWLSEHEAAMMEEVIYFAVDLAKKLGNPSFIDDPQYILVDEYQDLNKLEQEFINLLAANSKLLLVVGDPDQSIYGFKFAYPDGILEFSKQPGVDLHCSLETYRCPKRVIDVANQLLKQADPKRTQLLAAASADENGEVHFIQKDTQEQEFRYVLDAINQETSGWSKPESNTRSCSAKKARARLCPVCRSGAKRQDGREFLGRVRSEAGF
ncbi:MAG: UvrD-helicase domain-containing protein, partial [Terriglobales bacterium]